MRTNLAVSFDVCQLPIPDECVLHFLRLKKRSVLREFIWLSESRALNPLVSRYPLNLNISSVLM